MDGGCVCSYFVLMELEERKGDWWLRLGDLAAHEVIVVRCPCERSVEFPPGFLQRRYRLASDTLVYDLQFRLRCSHCNARAGFRITIFDGRTRGDSSKPRLERLVATGNPVCVCSILARVVEVSTAIILIGLPSGPTPRAPPDRICQAFFRISITLFASSSESTAA